MLYQLRCLAASYVCLYCVPTIQHMQQYKQQSQIFESLSFECAMQSHSTSSSDKTKQTHRIILTAYNQPIFVGWPVKSEWLQMITLFVRGTTFNTMIILMHSIRLTKFQLFLISNEYKSNFFKNEIKGIGTGTLPFRFLFSIDLLHLIIYILT